MSKECIYVCANCKHANYYQSYYWFPFLNPACCITKKKVEPNQTACENFELIGRLGR